MSTNRRILLAFVIAIVFMVLFGTFIQYAFSQIYALSAERQKLNDIQTLVSSIRSESVNYQHTGDRVHIYQVHDHIETIHEIVSEGGFNRLSSDMQMQMETILVELERFKSTLSDYMVHSDQIYALEAKLDTSMEGIIRLTDEHQVAEDPETQHLMHETNRELLMVRHLSSQNDLTTNADYLIHLDQLEKIAQTIKTGGRAFESQLFGSRILHYVDQQREYSEKLKAYQAADYDFHAILDELNAELEVIVDQAMVIERKMFEDKRGSLFGLSILIIFLFTVIAMTTNMAISKRNNRFFNAMILAIEEIANGEFSERLEFPGDRDIERLCSSINHMAALILESKTMLEQYNTQLEKVVDEKTNALNMANHELEAININLQQEKERLAISAMTDYLTQLKNRGYLVEVLKQRMHESKRYQKPFSVILLDIDHFKVVNDTYGHQAGDQVLVTISKILQSEMRQSDLAGRYGGEEFMILLSDTPIREALFVAERIRMNVDFRRFLDEEIHVTISAGVLEYHNETIDTYLKKVDDLLYEAKAAGRNTIKTNL